MSLITCNHASFSYEGNEVLSDVSFEVNPGDYLCIVGENGAGKSTLMKGILNLKKPSRGSIRTGEGLRPCEIGYLPQQTMIQKDFPASIREVVQSGRLNKLGLRLFYGKEDRQQAMRCMKQLNIWDMRHRCYRELSGGQQQRVLLARALCSTEKILMLDEPVTGLDPLMAQEMYEFVRKLNQEEHLTIIMVSHDLVGSIPYATHVLHLGKHQLYFGKRGDYMQTKLGKTFLGGEES